MFPVYLSQQIENMTVNGTTGNDDGRCWFCAPFAGKVTRVFISFAASPNFAQEISLRGRFGGVINPIGTIPNAAPIGNTIIFDVDQMDNKNQFETGSGFAIQSDGGGGINSKGGVTVEFYPK